MASQSNWKAAVRRPLWFAVSTSFAGQ